MRFSSPDTEASPLRVNNVDFKNAHSINNYPMDAPFFLIPGGLGICVWDERI